MKIVDGKLVGFKIEDIAYTDDDEKTIIVNVPDGVKIITTKFLSNEPVDIIYLPDSVTTIGENAFEEASYLEKIEGMQGVTLIDKNAFYGTNIRFFDCPPRLKTIGDYAFKRSFLSEISFDDELTSIGEHAFYDTNVRDVVLPKNLTFVGEGAFAECNNLISISISPKMSSLPNGFCESSGIERINIPKNIKVIGEGCFNDCDHLSEVNFEDGVKTIANEAFCNCDSLTHIYLPQSVESIGTAAFQGCSSLLDITLPPNVVFIGDAVFAECASLKSVTINDKLETISDETFYSCSQLQKVNFGKMVKVIGDGAFYGCSSLEEANLPDGLERIEHGAFDACTSLKSVRIPDTIKYIGHQAFADCSALEKVYIPNCDDLVIEDGAFRNCKNLKELTIENGQIGRVIIGASNLTTLKLGKDCDVFFQIDDLPWEMKYISRVGNEFVLSTSPIGEDCEEISSFNKNLYLGVITKMWDKREALKKTTSKREELAPLLNDIYENLGVENLIDFVDNARYTFYDQCKKDSFLIVPEFLDYFYSLGGFSKPVTEERISKKGNPVSVTVDYAQKVGEYFKALSNLTDQEQLLLAKEIRNVTPVKFNPEASKFLLDIKNTREIIMAIEGNEKIRYGGFLRDILSNFNEVQETNKSRKGSQRQLAPTVERFVEYFNENKFSGVKEEDRELAKFLSKFYVDQSTYDTAIEIKKEKEENGVGDSILGFHLKEDDAFKGIDTLSLKILEVAGETIDSILESTTDYTFDWLEKSDPNNYILGRLCNCCAELESAGFGIMHASIVNPDVQNLVIRDKSGKIIAKSTLYINREEGYGVFNNLQVSDKIPNADKIKIYKKYKLAVAAFAKAYNEQHPDKPLRQINIGMRINSLSELLEKYDKESTELLEAIDYGRYGRDGNTYNGDSKSRQMVVWEDEKE